MGANSLESPLNAGTKHALERQDLSCMYLAHHELVSVLIIVITMMIIIIITIITIVIIIGCYYCCYH